MNRLRRSRSNAMIAGICGGLGEYLGLDPVLVRLGFVLLAVFSGIGLLLYLLLLILMPQAGQDPNAAGQPAAPLNAETNPGSAGEPPAPPLEEKPVDSRNTILFLGIALIVLGAVCLLRNLDFRWFRWFGWHTFWPLLLIAIGLAILVRPAKGE